MLLQVVRIDRKGDVCKGEPGEADEPVIDRVRIVILQRAVKLIEPVVQEQGHVDSCDRKGHDAQKKGIGTLLFFGSPVAARQREKLTEKGNRPFTRSHRRLL